MTETPEYDWGTVQGGYVERLREPKVHPCPPEIVAIAQQAYDDQKFHGFTFPTEAIAADFTTNMNKYAGLHTVPKTTVTAVIDPENTGDLCRVHWQARLRRGRK